MDNNEITITPTSYITADVTPIVILDESGRSQVRFELQQINNPKNYQEKLRGKFIYTVKKSDSTFNDVISLNKRSIKSGESFELALSCSQTYKLWQALTERYKLVKDKNTPWEEVTYTLKDEEYDKFKELLKNKEELVKLLKSVDLTNINWALNIEYLKRIKEEIKNNLNNSDEVGFWQPLFEKNSWILSQLFNTPYMIMQGCHYVGGKSFDFNGGKKPDFIYQNGITKNVSIIEIKTPVTTLTQNTSYRAGILPITTELTGSLIQLLSQKDSLYKEFNSLKVNSKLDVEANNIHCILLVGNYSTLTPDAKNSFENFRNELRSISIICYDELLERINMLLSIFEDVPSDEKINSPDEFYLPF